MNIGTKGISMKFGLMILALGIVGYLVINRQRKNWGGVDMKIIPKLPKNFFIILLVGVGGYLLYRNIHRN